MRGGQHTLVERLGYKVQGNASRLGTWTEGDKAELLALVTELQPCGATDWEVIADKLGRWSKACLAALFCRCFHGTSDHAYVLAEELLTVCLCISAASNIMHPITELLLSCLSKIPC